VSGEARIGILISGRGSNMEAIVREAEAGRLPGRVAIVISDEPLAAGLEKAKAHGVETLVLDRRSAGGREAQDRRIAAALQDRKVDLICLAGYMKLLTPVLLSAFPGRILNVHPALLPAFPGLEAQRKALEHGVRYTGVTVHLVDAGVDSGPIVLQAVVPVLADDTVESLSDRILDEEHRIYPEAIRLFLQGRLRVEGRRVRILAAAEGD
jgi:phosphoribosylglycinamide formyltransferase 1